MKEIKIKAKGVNFLINKTVDGAYILHWESKKHKGFAMRIGVYKTLESARVTALDLKHFRDTNQI